MTIYLYALTCICSFKVCAILYYQCIYILNGTSAVVMHVQLQLCIIATSNFYNSYSYCIITIMVTLIYVCTLHDTFCCWEPFVYVCILNNSVCYSYVQLRYSMY